MNKSENKKLAKRKVKQIKKKVREYVKCDKSYTMYFLWLVFIFGKELDKPEETEKCYSLLKQKIETSLAYTAKKHSEKFPPEFAMYERKCVEYVV